MEDIGDPCGDRVMKNVPMISREPLTEEQLWTTKSKKSGLMAYIDCQSYFTNQLFLYQVMVEKFQTLNYLENTYFVKDTLTNKN